VIAGTLIIQRMKLTKNLYAALQFLCIPVAITVEFRMDNYPVLESVGEVETCLILNCQAAQTILVTISAWENTVPEAEGTMID
jgi:hypothetical protein